MNIIKQGFKRPLTYYIWGSLNLTFSFLINPILEIVDNSYILFTLGVIALIIGGVIDLGKYRVDSIDDEFLEPKIKDMKYMYFQNVLRNLYLLIDYNFIKGSYLCRFKIKTGSILTLFVDKKDIAEEYKSWYLSETDNSIKTIIIDENIDKNISTRILKDDIELFEYKKITNFQRNIIVPIKAFFKQPSIASISINKLIIFSIMVLSIVSLAYYTDNNYSFIGDGSIYTLMGILRASTSIISTMLILGVIIVVSSGIIFIKKAISKYYVNDYSNNRSLGKQLLIFSLLPICFSLIIKPSFIDILNIFQSNGYFLP